MRALKFKAMGVGSRGWAGCHIPVRSFDATSLPGEIEVNGVTPLLTRAVSLFLAIVITAFVSSKPAVAQTASARTRAGSNAAGSVPCPEASRLIREATALFESGQDAYVRLGPAAARPLFDEAVDVFLDCGCNLTTSVALMTAYRDLIEKVHWYDQDALARRAQEVQEYRPSAADLTGPASPSATTPIDWDAIGRTGQPCEKAPEPASANAVAKLVSGGIRLRGEFETTTAYESYKSELAARHGIGVTKYCFEVNRVPTDVRYDADRAIFRDKIEFVVKPGGKERISVVLSLDGTYRAAPEWHAEFDYSGLTLSLHAAPDVARRVKPLIAGLRYFVVGRVVRGTNLRGEMPSWVIAEALLKFEVEELIIAHGTERCVVARIPLASSTTRQPEPPR